MIIIEPLTDAEIAAAVQRSGWVLSTPEVAQQFRGLAKSIAHSLEVKNSDLTK